MDYFVQIIVSGLTFSAMYALAAVGLVLVWGAFNMLNMAHGIIMTLGAYFALMWAELFGLPLIFAAPFAMLCGGFMGAFVYFVSAHWMIKQRDFETTIIIATFGLGMAMEAGLLKLLSELFHSSPYSQPLSMGADSFLVATVPVSYQRIIIWGSALILILILAAFLKRTSFGRAIRAVAQNSDAARLMGVRVRNVYIAVLALASALAGVSGIMLSSFKDVHPLMGGALMLKAFIVIVLAGLGNLTGALYAALLIGMVEATVKVLIADQYGFTAILILVILALIWKPAGIFGRSTVARQ
ncbi:MAG: branched-chain amino acid ABC transporter permease [Proteobacteria bacterium]|nr:branched-chain amino acid ABC transporter permease [Pseudomonadota bacterium]MDA1357227.1 branched-chain amino acid ABC transporter permease [Pseudomonadota bacterium]